MSEQNWEKKFNKQFIDEGCESETALYGVEKDDIKSFIKSILVSQREEIRNKAREILYDLSTFDYPNFTEQQVNEIINDCKKFIENI